MPATGVALPHPITERLTPKRLAQARRALLAIAHGLHTVDAQLLYGFTAEELTALRRQLPQQPALLENC